jgi:uncharacterized membrane protein
VEDTLHIIAIWMHVLGIAIFVGPQFFLAFAWVPVARTIEDQRVRANLTRKLTRRFGHLGGVGLVLIVVAGTYLISTWRDFYSVGDDVSFADVRYGVVFMVKMTLFIVMLAVVGLHTFMIGPRLVSAMEAEVEGRGSPQATRTARGASMALSILGLVLALAIMVLGVMMNTKEWSFA